MWNNHHYLWVFCFAVEECITPKTSKHSQVLLWNCIQNTFFTKYDFKQTVTWRSWKTNVQHELTLLRDVFAIHSIMVYKEEKLFFQTKYVYMSVVVCYVFIAFSLLILVSAVKRFILIEIAILTIRNFSSPALPFIWNGMIVLEITRLFLLSKVPCNVFRCFIIYVCNEMYGQWAAHSQLTVIFQKA